MDSKEQITLAMKIGRRDGAELALKALLETISAAKDKFGDKTLTLCETEELIKELSVEILKSFNDGDIND